MERVIVIPALGDNFVYLFRYEECKAIVIDPAEGALVLNALKRYDLELSAILVTHHHFDHTAGVAELKAKTNCRVITSSQAGGGGLSFGEYRVKIIPTPGHTSDSVCFYIEPAENTDGIVFTGDTLFISGCGRPIENDAVTLWESLEKLASLPDDTLVYPGHDYTEENYEFALTIEPGNKTIEKLFEEIRDGGGMSAVPSTIGREKLTNVFLRSDRAEIKAAVNMAGGSDGQVFAELRKRKNIFG